MRKIRGSDFGSSLQIKIMFKKVGKHALPQLLTILIISPLFVNGQDLGSSNRLFRPANPKVNTVRKNKPAVAKKEVSRPSAAKRKTVSSAKTKRAETAGKAARQPAVNIQKPIDEKIIINVGGEKAVENAEVLFEKAIESGNAARDERNYTLAEAAYRRAQSLKPRDSRSIYGLGNLFSDQQRWEEAEKAYRLALDLEPDSPEANIALSFVLTQPVPGSNLIERYAEAEKTARKAIELDPLNAVAYDQLGVSLELGGAIGDETQQAYRKAIQLDQTFAPAYAHLARLLRRKGLEAESGKAYTDAIRMAVDVPTMILVADVMQSQQRFTESEQLLRRALKSDPKNPTALFLLGRALTTREEFAEAEKLLKTSVEISPKSFVSYALLSSLYVRRRNFDEAERTLLKALRVVSANEKKRLAQEFEFVGDGYLRAGRKKDAVRVYQQAIALDAENTALNEKLGLAQKS